MSLNVYQQEMDKYLSTLTGETMRSLEAMENHIRQLGPMQNDFKINFLKYAQYQYVSVKKIIRLPYFFEHEFYCWI